MSLIYTRTGDVIEITIRDCSGRKLESFTISIEDKKRYAFVMNYLKEKYGFEPMIDKFPEANSKENKINKINWWD